MIARLQHLTRALVLAAVLGAACGALALSAAGCSKPKAPADVPHRLPPPPPLGD